MPLLNAKPGQIPPGHPRCRFEPCVRCRANARLEPADWEVVRFYEFVRDQVENLTPFADRAWFAPRLEAWLAALEFLEVPAAQRSELLDDARAIHERIQERLVIPELQRLLPDEIRPPGWTDVPAWPVELTPYRGR